MNQLDNEKFGAFITTLRKEKSLTQKELAERLFVSDKAVSKWERGLSIPNVALLLPIAETFEVTVTELLRGERIQTGQLAAEEVENLVTGSLDLSIQDSMKQRKRKWIRAFLICAALSGAEILLLYRMGVTTDDMKEDVLLITGLMLFFSGWFCIFAKEILPVYYDENKIGYYSQGVFRIHLPGLHFNNSNWMPVCSAMKSWMLGTAVLYPLLCIAVVRFAGMKAWKSTGEATGLLSLAAMVIFVYLIGKKHE